VQLSLIVAMTRDGVIGLGGELPWRLPADLKRFKALTMGHHLIMGRKTWDSLGRPLPGRISIVLKRLASPYDYDFYDEETGLPRPLYQGQGFPKAGEPADWMPVAFVHDLDSALRLSEFDDSPFVIGGGEIYAQTLPRVERMYVTWVEAELAGDTRFPDWNPANWELVAEERHSADAKNEYDYTFATYHRR
jgi:dihydrofolate reductase